MLVDACGGWVDELGHVKRPGIDIRAACMYMVKQLCSPVILGRSARPSPLEREIYFADGKLGNRCMTTSISLIYVGPSDCEGEV